MGGADLHKRSAEGWKETGGGRVAPILDSPGDVPPKPGSREEHFLGYRRCQWKAAGRSARGREGSLLVANATAAKRSLGAPDRQGRMRQCPDLQTRNQKPNHGSMAGTI